jgi:hypothetical protein
VKRRLKSRLVTERKKKLKIKQSGGNRVEEIRGSDKKLLRSILKTK